MYRQFPASREISESALSSAWSVAPGAPLPFDSAVPPSTADRWGSPSGGDVGATLLLPDRRIEDAQKKPAREGSWFAKGSGHSTWHFGRGQDSIRARRLNLARPIRIRKPGSHGHGDSTEFLAIGDGWRMPIRHRFESQLIREMPAPSFSIARPEFIIKDEIINHSRFRLPSV